MGIEFLQQSKKWDMDVSFEDLVRCNPKCKLEGEYYQHWSDDGFGFMRLYMQHPSDDKCSLIIGICEDGFCYDGDGTGLEKLEYMDTNEAIKKMHEFREKIMEDMA